MPRQIVGRISSILPSLNLPLRTIATGAHKRPCRCIYSGSRGQINSGVHVVKSVVTTTREHQPLSERLVTGEAMAASKDAVLGTTGLSRGTRHPPGRFVENSRALTIRAALYIAGGMSRSRDWSSPVTSGIAPYPLR